MLQSVMPLILMMLAAVPVVFMTPAWQSHTHAFRQVKPRRQCRQWGTSLCYISLFSACWNSQWSVQRLFSWATNFRQCPKLCDNLINIYCEAQPMQVEVMHCNCMGSHIRQQKAAMQLCSQMPIAHSGWTIRMKHKIQTLKSLALLSAILYPVGWFVF